VPFEALQAVPQEAPPSAQLPATRGKEQQQQQAQASEAQQAQASVAEQKATYNKAFSACMEAKGYTVK
jgi:hypothetical protein